jgi:hypothetical protein
MDSQYRTSAAHVEPDETARASALDFARRLVPHLQAVFGADLVGIYLIGSLSHAGFSRRYSDVDIALIMETGLSTEGLDRIRSKATALSPEWSSKLSVFWTDRHFSIGRFPPLDRIDFLDHAVVLMEREEVLPPRPTLKEIRGYLSGSPFEVWAETARRFASAEEFDPRNRKAYLKALLYPGRFYYSWMTGLMGSNDTAVAYLSETRPAQLDIGLITGALQCRQAAADPDALFPARTILPSQIDACAALVCGPNAVL